MLIVIMSAHFSDLSHLSASIRVAHFVSSGRNDQRPPNTNAAFPSVVAAVSAAAFAVGAVCDRRSSAVATQSSEMHAIASDAKICSAQILMLLQPAEPEEGSRRICASAR